MESSSRIPSFCVSFPPAVCVQSAACSAVSTASLLAYGGIAYIRTDTDVTYAHAYIAVTSRSGIHRSGIFLKMT